MKIRHFSGYGFINAKKVSKHTFTDIWGNHTTELKIEVSGNHEQGLERNDLYDLYNWLVRRFDKSVKSYTDIEFYSYDDIGYADEKGLWHDVGLYKFILKEK